MCDVWEFMKNMERHVSSATCRKAEQRRVNEKRQDEQHEAEEVVFEVNGKRLERVRAFNYLGRVLTENDDDSVSIDSRIKKARGRWVGIARVLKREGANARVMGRFYLAVVQALLLYGSESWAIKRRDMKKLERFHLRAIRHMTGEHIWCGVDGWEYPNHEGLMEKCGVFPMETYIERRRGTLWRYLLRNRRDLMEKAKGCKLHSKDARKILWWDQGYLTKKDMLDKTNFLMKK